MYVCSAFGWLNAIIQYTVVYFGSTVARLVSPRPAPQTRRHDDATEGASFFLREALGA